MRSLLNQATYSTTASSSCERLAQTRSAMSSVLKESTKLSATACRRRRRRIRSSEGRCDRRGSGCSRSRCIGRQRQSDGPANVSAGCSLMQGHCQRIEDERGAHVAGELPADDPPTVGVDHEAEEHEALPAPEVGEVGEPQLSGREAANSRSTRPVSALPWGRAWWSATAFAALGALDPVLAHQASDAVASDTLAGPQQRLPHPPRPIGQIVGLVELPNVGEQALVLDTTSRAPAGCSLVVSGRRHAQGLADRLDPEALAVLLDERAHFGRCRSSSPNFFFFFFFFFFF